MPDVILDRPINLKATKGAFGTKIVLSWTAIPLAKNYQVYKFNDTEQQYKLLGSAADTTLTDNSVATLTKTFYKVKVFNSEKEYSLFSDIDYGYASGKNYTKAFSFGSEGAGIGQFEFAMHVETDKFNNIYVSDENNRRVQKFDNAGNYLSLFYSGPEARAVAFLSNGNAVVTNAFGVAYVSIIDKDGNFVTRWGTYGTGDSKFQNIEEIALDDEQNIYVVDGQNNYVQKFDQTGKFLLKFQAATQAPNQIDGPYPFGIAYMNNKIFVTSPRNSMVRVFDKSGKFLTSWDAGAASYAIKSKGSSLYIACSKYILKTDEKGEIKEKIGEGDFSTNTAIGLAINSNDEIIVSDVYAHKILIFKHL
ncbi:6-bladed beta-propeller [Mucilaginibacter sp.]|uniref:6-bladed beta-propeller n=1 Tax=Mucilaginibacter sp. TaxID=1882438 RepID=UPI003264C67A